MAIFAVFYFAEAIFLTLAASFFLAVLLDPSMVRAYFLGSLIAGLGLAVAQWLLFAGLGLQNAAGLGLLTGFSSIVPLMGLPVAFFVAAVQALLQFDRLPRPYLFSDNHGSTS